MAVCYASWRSLAAGVLAVLASAASAGALVINPTFSDGAGQSWNSDLARKAVIERAIDDWTSLIYDKRTVNVNFTFAHAGGSYLAQWSGGGTFAPGVDIYPWTAGLTHTICFNVDYFTGANHLWFDPTPTKADDLPSAYWDALSVTRHELCHMLGFCDSMYVDNFGLSSERDRWTDNIVRTTFDPGGLNVQMAGRRDLGHVLDGGTTAGDLMTPAIYNGVRRAISDTDISMLTLAHGYTLLTPGDFNEDGRVDGKDFLVWQAHYPLLGGAALGDGDANGDGVVNGKDFLVWQANYRPLQITSTVPEPCAAVLLLLTASRLFLRPGSFARRR
jgi:hypothetical protein